MGEISRPTPEDISAFLDGELDAAQRAEISYYLSTNPDAAQEVARQQALNDGLRALRRGDKLGDMPPSVVEALGKLKDSSPEVTSLPPIRRPLAVAAAAAGIAAIIWIGVFFVPNVGNQASGNSEIAADVLYFLDLGTESAEFGPLEQAAISRTLTGFDVSLRDTPRLRQAGFTLTGGRLIAKNGLGGILLFYRTRDGSQIGLMISAGSQKPVMPVDSILETANALHWRKDTLTFAAVGRQNITELRAFQLAFLSQ